MMTYSRFMLLDTYAELKRAMRLDVEALLTYMVRMNEVCLLDIELGCVFLGYSCNWHIEK